MTQTTKSLNDILDEALDDFACQSQQPTATATATTTTPVTQDSNGKIPVSQVKIKSSQTPSSLEKDSTPSSLESDIRKLSDMMQEFMTKEKPDPSPVPTHSSQNLNDTITETLKSLDQVAQSTSKFNATANSAHPMQDMNFSEFSSDPEMAKMFQNLWEAYQTPGIHPQADASAAASGDPFDDSVLESLVNQLLSKDILFEPLKDLDNKYPQWLAEHHPDKNPKTGLSASQYATYVKQADCLHELILLWEREETKKEATDDAINSIALELLQKVQDCGPPPEDLLPKIAESSTSGIQSLFPSNTPSPECSIM